MKFLAIIYNDESQYADATPEDIAATFQAHGEFGEAAGKAGVFQGGEGLQPVGHGDDRARARRRADAHRRPVRRDQGAARRLLPARVQGPRRRAQLGRADPGGQERRDRGAPGHGLRGDGRPDRRPPDRPRRPPVPARVGTGGRDPRPHPRRPRPRRGGGAGRVPHRARALAASAGCRTTRRPGSSPRRATARSTGSAPSAAGRPAGGARGRAAGARRRRGPRGDRAREPDPRRAAAADLHHLPPGARRGGARRR